MEKLIDYNNKLNSIFWDDDMILKDGFKEGLLIIANFFIKKYLPDNNIKIHDVLFTGSLANYNYGDNSDIDLHIMIDFDDIKKDDYSFVFDYFKQKRYDWKNNFDVKVKGYPVEISVNDINEELKDTQASYSLYQNRWVKKPLKQKLKVDKKELLDLVKKSMAFIDSLDNNASLQKMKIFKDMIKDIRNTSIKKYGDLSLGNLLFKVLRNNGYLKKLDDIRTNRINKKLSIEEQN